MPPTSPHLDADLLDTALAYQLYVVQAEEFRRVVRAWYIESHGVEPMLHDYHFAYWRVIDERRVWGTLRHAMETEWPIAGQPPSIRPPTPDPQPVPPILSPGPQLPTDPPPPLSQQPRLIRVGEGFRPRMMSDRANAWVDGDVAWVFGGHADGDAHLFRVDLRNGASARVPWPFPYGGETEGWYWTPDGRIVLLHGPRLRRVDPLPGSRRTGQDELLLDISQTNPGWDLWQPHSSDDGQTHSATVRDTANPLPNGRYPYVGTVTLHHGKQDWWPKIGVLDESQVSRNGRKILIKEKREGSDDNRVIDFDTRDTRWLKDMERALGHSDCGPDFVVGEADKPDPGAMVIRYLDRLTEEPRILLHTINMGYVSARGGRIAWSNDTHISLVDPSSGAVTPLVEHGASAGSDYDKRPKGNLDHTGRVIVYMVDGVISLLDLAA